MLWLKFHWQWTVFSLIAAHFARKYAKHFSSTLGLRVDNFDQPIALVRHQFCIQTITRRRRQWQHSRSFLFIIIIVIFSVVDMVLSSCDFAAYAHTVLNATTKQQPHFFIFSFSFSLRIYLSWPQCDLETSRTIKAVEETSIKNTRRRKREWKIWNHANDLVSFLFSSCAFFLFIFALASWQLNLCSGFFSSSTVCVYLCLLKTVRTFQWFCIVNLLRVQNDLLKTKKKRRINAVCLLFDFGSCWFALVHSFDF